MLTAKLAAAAPARARESRLARLSLGDRGRTDDDGAVEVLPEEVLGDSPGHFLRRGGGQLDGGPPNGEPKGGTTLAFSYLLFLLTARTAFLTCTSKN